MFLNDQIGDCGIAGVYHLLMLWITQGGNTPQIEDANVLKVYEKISGYNPKDPNTDVGVNLRDVLSYWKNTGIPDKKGVLHKIGAYVQLTLSDHDEIKLAQYLFSGLYIGFKFPAFAMDQFNAGQPWDVQTKNAAIDGGHCVTPTGYGKITVLAVTKEGIWVITWGKVQFMTWAFWDKYVDEAWAVLDIEFLKGGISPDGFDLATLQYDLVNINNPKPQPTPTPQPVPIPPIGDCPTTLSNVKAVVYSTAITASSKISKLKNLIPK